MDTLFRQVVLIVNVYGHIAMITLSLLTTKVGLQMEVAQLASVMLDMLVMATTALWTLTWMAILMWTLTAEIPSAKKTTVRWFKTLTKRI